MADRAWRRHSPNAQPLSAALSGRAQLTTYWGPFVPARLGSSGLSKAGVCFQADFGWGFDRCPSGQWPGRGRVYVPGWVAQVMAGATPAQSCSNSFPPMSSMHRFCGCRFWGPFMVGDRLLLKAWLAGFHFNGICIRMQCAKVDLGQIVSFLTIS